MKTISALTMANRNKKMMLRTMRKREKTADDDADDESPAPPPTPSPDDARGIDRRAAKKADRKASQDAAHVPTAAANASADDKGDDESAPPPTAQAIVPAQSVPARSAACPFGDNKYSKRIVKPSAADDVTNLALLQGLQPIGADVTPQLGPSQGQIVDDTQSIVPGVPTLQVGEKDTHTGSMASCSITCRH